MDLALPEVHDWLHDIHSEVYKVSQDVMQIKDTISKFRVCQDDVNNQVHQFPRHTDSFQLPTPAGTEATIGAVDTILPTKIKILFQNHTLV